MMNDAARMYREGRSLKSIARELDISLSTVKRMLLKDPGYSPTRIGGTRITKISSDKALALESLGRSWRSISIELGISAKALKRAIKYYAAQDPIKSGIP